MQASGYREGMPPLTQAAIVDAAVALADQNGVEKLSMRSLARNLGVEAMSLYHHVANKTELLAAMVDVVFTEFYHPHIGQPWPDEMRQRAVTGRAVLLRHRWAIGLTDTIRQPGPASLAHHNATLGCLRAGGFTVRQAAQAYAVLDSQLFGFVLQEQSLPEVTSESIRSLGGNILAANSSADLPYLAEIYQDVLALPGYEFGHDFNFGVELVIEGLGRILRRGENAE